MKNSTKPNILIVDDVEDNLVLIESILEVFDVNLIMAQSGTEAIEKIPDTEIALALIDIRMPGMSGVELADRLQHDETRNTFPIIFITAQAKDELELEKCYESGAVDFILKPVNKRILTSKVKIFLELFLQKQQIVKQNIELENTTNELALLNQRLIENGHFTNSLLQTIPFGMTIVDQEGSVLFINENFKKTIGKEAIGKKCWELYKDDKTQCTDCPLIKGLGLGETTIKEINGALDDRILEIHYTGMLFKGQRATLQVIEDITERKKTERALNYALQQLQFHIENTPLAVIKFDNKYQICEWSDKATQLFGWNSDEVLGKKIKELPLLFLDDKTEIEELSAGLYQGSSTNNNKLDLNFRKDGSVITCEWFNSALFDANNNLVSVHSLIQDITERKKAEEALRVSENLYRSLFENMLNGFSYCQMHFDENNNPIDFTYLAVNEAFGTQTGLHDVVGKRVSEVIPGIFESDPKLFEFYGSVAIGGRPVNFEIYLESLNMWLTISAYCTGIGFFVAIVEVITERKKFENALKESEYNYRTFFDTMGDMILVADMTGRIIFTNKAIKQKLGYSSEELSEMNAIDLNPPDVRQEALEIFDAMLKDERETCPLPLATKSGKLIPAESRLWFGRWNGNDCIFGISKDISAEQEAKQRFESIFRYSPTPMALSILPEQTFTDVNNAFLKILGFSIDEIVGKKPVELGLFANLDELSNVSRILIENNRISDIEIQIKARHGAIINGLFSGEIIQINGRKYLLTVMIDITRRKIAEEALMESEKKYRQLVELAHEGIWTIDTESVTTYVNPRMAEILGYSVEEMMGSSLFSFMDEQGVALAKSNVERRKQGIKEQHEFEFIRKDGKRIYTSIETTPINGETGNYLGALALVADITERKIAEDKLKESEEVARSLINAIIESAALVDPDGIVLAHNEVVAERLGLGKNELLGKCVYDVLPPEVSASRKVMIDQVFRTGKPIHFEDKRSGRIIFNSIFPIFDSSGTINRIAIFGNDITEIKNNEKKLLESEKMLTSIIENLPIMLFVKDAESLRFVKLNKTGEELLGYKRDEMIGKSDYDFFSKEEAEYFILNDLEVLETKKLKEIAEEKIQTKHRGERILSTKKIPILNAEGNAEFLLGISEDITSRKETENALRESEKMYRTLLNASPEGIIIMDMTGSITEISNITLEIFGYENKQEFLDKQLIHFLPDEEQHKLNDILTRTQLEGLVQNVEFVLTRKNRSQFICELSTTLIQETDGKPKAYMAIIRDISQRKKMEQQLIRTERMVSLGEMASGMAHEINQPLLSITLSIENMLHKIEKANAVDDIYFKTKSEKIFEDIQRIGYIIDHVRAFSRDHDDYIVTSFNINESIKNAISMISEQFKHHGIKLTSKLEKNVHPINGNTYKFEQVILNLLINAKDALEEKARLTNEDYEKTIRIRTYYDDSTNFVEVKDNGIGIKTEDIDRIMFPFYTTKEVGKGTGLGLSISFGIIKELNGNIDIESHMLTGTTFRITIPKPVSKEKLQN